MFWMVLVRGDFLQRRGRTFQAKRSKTGCARSRVPPSPPFAPKPPPARRSVACGWPLPPHMLHLAWAFMLGGEWSNG